MKNIFICLSVLILISACEGSDPVENTPVKDSGQIIVTDGGVEPVENIEKTISLFHEDHYLNFKKRELLNQKDAFWVIDNQEAFDRFVIEYNDSIKSSNRTALIKKLETEKKKINFNNRLVLIYFNKRHSSGDVYSFTQELKVEDETVNITQNYDSSIEVDERNTSGLRSLQTWAYEIDRSITEVHLKHDDAEFNISMSDPSPTDPLFKNVLAYVADFDGERIQVFSDKVSFNSVLETLSPEDENDIKVIRTLKSNQVDFSTQNVLFYAPEQMYALGTLNLILDYPSQSEIELDYEQIMPMNLNTENDPFTYAMESQIRIYIVDKTIKNMTLKLKDESYKINMENGEIL